MMTTAYKMSLKASILVVHLKHDNLLTFIPETVVVLCSEQHRTLGIISFLFTYLITKKRCTLYNAGRWVGRYTNLY